MNYRLFRAVACICVICKCMIEHVVSGYEHASLYIVNVVKCVYTLGSTLECKII